MVEELFTDAERMKLLSLALEAVPAKRGDDALTNIIAKLAGTDTVLIARRGYPAPQVETGRDRDAGYTHSDFRDY